MANYAASFRSNYFKVKDTAAFLMEINEKHEVDIVAKEDRVGLFASSLTDDGTIPVRYEPEDEDQENPISIMTDIIPHLVENEVAVFFEIGQEKLRYLTGRAVAVHSSGETTSMDFNDIYKQAQEAFGDTATINPM